MANFIFHFLIWNKNKIICNLSNSCIGQLMNRGGNDYIHYLFRFPSIACTLYIFFMSDYDTNCWFLSKTMHTWSTQTTFSFSLFHTVYRQVYIYIITEQRQLTSAVLIFCICVMKWTIIYMSEPTSCIKLNIKLY